MTGNDTADAGLSGGGKVSFSSREKGGKMHSFTNYIREDKHADLDGLLMCVHLHGVKFKFILIMYGIKFEGYYFCVALIYSVREEEKEVHSLFVMKAKLKYEQCSIVNDGEFDNLICIISSYIERFYC